VFVSFGRDKYQIFRTIRGVFSLPMESRARQRRVGNASRVPSYDRDESRKRPGERAIGNAECRAWPRHIRHFRRWMTYAGLTPRPQNRRSPRRWTMRRVTSHSMHGVPRNDSQ